MLLRFSCPMCATILEIPRAKTGLEGPCPVCGATIVAPSVVLAPPSRLEALSNRSAPAGEELALNSEGRAGTTPSTVPHHTARLCDLPPRPAFPARAPGQLPEPKPQPLSKTRRRRHSVRHPSGPSLAEFVRKEFWLIVLALVVLAVGAAFAMYGDAMFSGFESAPPMHR